MRFDLARNLIKNLLDKHAKLRPVEFVTAAEFISSGVERYTGLARLNHEAEAVYRSGTFKRNRSLTGYVDSSGFALMHYLLEFDL